MAAVAQEPDVESTSAAIPALSLAERVTKIVWYYGPTIWRPVTESDLKGNTSRRASVIDYYPGTQDPNGTGTGLAAIACDNGGPYYVVNDHTLNKNDWFCTRPNGGSPGPELCQFISDRAIFGILKDMEDSAAATTSTTERVEIGRLAAFIHSPTARVSAAANPGGATVVLVLDSGASIHAVGEARIMQDIQLFSFGMWATQPDDSRLRIIGKGTIEMNGFSIPNVYLVEGLRKNLISVSQLDIKHALCSCFHGRQCTVMRPDGTVVGGATLEDDGLYKLRFLEVPQPEE